jgi:hypothetical protein
VVKFRGFTQQKSNPYHYYSRIEYFINPSSSDPTQKLLRSPKMRKKNSKRGMTETERNQKLLCRCRRQQQQQQPDPCASQQPFSNPCMLKLHNANLRTRPAVCLQRERSILNQNGPTLTVLAVVSKTLFRRRGCLVVVGRLLVGIDLVGSICDQLVAVSSKREHLK